MSNLTICPEKAVEACDGLNDVDERKDGETVTSLAPADDTGTGDQQHRRALLWKIDIVIMPILMASYFFQFLDKSSISYANLFGIQKATHLVGQDFAWLGSIFYFGYLSWQPPAAWLLVRVPVRYHLSVIVVIWGTTLGCMAACTSFAGLATCRFVLGVSEAAMVPIIGTVIGMWYTRSEQVVRVGVIYTGVGTAQILGGLLAYGMFKIDDTFIEKWQFVFVVLGPLTVVYGILILFVMPNSPKTAWFLSPEKRGLALDRVRENMSGTAVPKWQHYQVVEALKDIRLYLIGLTTFAASVPTGGITSFGAVIVKGFGYEVKTTTLIGMSTGVSEFAAFVAGMVLFALLKMRTATALICIGISIIGACLMVALPTHLNNARFAGYCLVFWYPVGQMITVPWIQSMFGGHTKRAIVYAVFQVSYASGNIVGAQVFRAKDAPNYTPAKIVILAMLCLHAATIALICLVHRVWNRQRRGRGAITATASEQTDIPDQTDWELSSFVYTY